MANIIYMTIHGKKQGLISAGCGTSESIGNKYQRNHPDEILVYSVNQRMTREQHANHHPLIITKSVDKSSPLLGLAISENERLDINFDFYQISSNGSLEKFYNIKLRDATMKDMTINYPHALTHHDRQAEEMISFNYVSITWSHIKAGTSAYSIDAERVF